MTLKGQNFRILTFDATANKFKCIGMATNCTVSLNTNTESADTKNDTGMASKPTVTSKSWSVSVESLSVADVAAMLTAIKSLTPFTLLWDETATSDNQTAQKATFARKGQAYLNDATFTFNDRANATKSLQFSGSGALETLAATPSVETISAGSYTKGQYVRFFLSSDNSNTPSKVIAGAKELSLHVSMTLESATTKDTPGDWDVQEPTALNYDISTSALIRANDTITSGVLAQTLADLESIYEASSPVKWLIGNVSGDNQRTLSSTIVSGSCIVASLTLNGPNRQNADYSASFTGWGDYAVAA